MEDPSAGWTENDSVIFVDVGDSFSPPRDLSAKAFDQIGFADGVSETFVELCCGAGWLSTYLLHRHAGLNAILLDASETMLACPETTLGECRERATLRRFDLATDWPLDDVKGRAAGVITSLAFHHLDAMQKRDAFRQAMGLLAPGRPFLILDLIAPASRAGWDYAAAEWDRMVRERATADEVREFLEHDWNYFAHPDDPVDQPSGIFEQLRWLADAGFSGVDVFWMRAGHAMYGGFAPS